MAHPEDIRLIEFITYEGNLRELLWKILYGGEMNYIDKATAHSTLQSFYRNKWDIAPPVWVMIVAEGNPTHMGDVQEIAKETIKVTI